MFILDSILHACSQQGESVMNLCEQFAKIRTEKISYQANILQFLIY